MRYSRRLAGTACAVLVTYGLSPAIGSSSPVGLADQASSGAISAPPSVLPQFFQRFYNSSQPPTTAQCLAAIGISCYEPAQIQTAYDEQPLFDQGTTGAGETIVIVDSLGSPTIQSDLAAFDQAFGLPNPPSFNIIQPAGAVPAYTGTALQQSWAGETTLDVEWSHVMAPEANILLVETPVPSYQNPIIAGDSQIAEAENYVINNHLGDVISQSFGQAEQTFPSLAYLNSLDTPYVNAYEHDITVLASSGDSGATSYSNAAGTLYYPYRVVNWPASDPLVTAVGGTQLSLDAAGNRLAPDVAWNDTYNPTVMEDFTGSTAPTPYASGGGVSAVYPRPSYQAGVAFTTGTSREVPDIAMSASCADTVDVYSSTLGGWLLVCGTSEASPLIAGVVALADQVAGHPLGLINPALYAMGAEHATGIVPVTQGNNTVTFTQNGQTYTVPGFSANPQYSLVTGLGTINVAEFVPALVHAASSLRYPGPPGFGPGPGQY